MVIGLTGGIGTGKSTVSQILQRKGYKVIDLDIISHEVIKFPKVVEKIVQNFGREILESDDFGKYNFILHTLHLRLEGKLFLKISKKDLF